MSPSDAASFTADYFNGRDTAKRRVSVARSEAAIRIAGHDVAFDVPLVALRFQPRVAGLPLRIGLPDGGVLVAEPEAVEAVLDVPRAASLAHRLESHRAMIFGSIGGLAGALLLGWLVGLPWAAERVARALPEDVEAELSVQTMKQLDRFAFHPSDLPQARRDEISRPFEAMLGRSGAHATLHFRNGGWIGPNAFALPGAKIVVTDQLVEAMDDDDQVMAVLAHEIGHVVHRHTVRNLLQTSFVALGSVLLLGDVTAVSSLAAAVPTVLLHSGYSRDFEREADRFAFQLLQDTGRSPRLFAQALDRIQRAAAEAAGRKGGRGDAVPSFLSTHPDTRERMRAARDAASP